MLINSTLFVRKIENGYLVELYNGDENPSLFFDNWKDAFKFIENNQPRTYEKLKSTDLIALD